MQPISNDKRKDIVAAKQRKEPVTKIIEWFNVSRSSIERIWSKYQETGSYEPIPYIGRISSFTEKNNADILEEVKKEPDITLVELIDKLSLDISISGLSRHMAKLELTLKKRLYFQRENSEKMLSLNEKNGKKINKT